MALLNMTRPQRLLSLLVPLGFIGCTELAPWAKEGSAGFPCFPEKTCDDGLTCTAGICLGAGGSGCELGSPIAIDPIPEATVHERVVVRGTVGSSPSGQAEASEVIVTAGDNVQRIAAGPGWTFCADLPLLPDGPTQISVVARNDDGCVTEPLGATVTYNPNGTNVVAGLVPRGLLPRVETLTDGDTDTTQVFSFNDRRDPPDAEICDTYSYLWFALDAPVTMHRMIVRYPPRADFVNYILCWSLLSSNAASPGVPFPARSDTWSVIGQSAEGRREQLVYDFPQPVSARHIALLVFEDGQRGEVESFELSEVELYSPSEEPPYAGCQ